MANQAIYTRRNAIDVLYNNVVKGDNGVYIHVNSVVCYDNAIDIRLNDVGSRQNAVVASVNLIDKPRNSITVADKSLVWFYNPLHQRSIIIVRVTVTIVSFDIAFDCSSFNLYAMSEIYGCVG